jgi:hypothetical protein
VKSQILDSLGWTVSWKKHEKNIRRNQTRLQILILCPYPSPQHTHTPTFYSVNKGENEIYKVHYFNILDSI